MQTSRQATTRTTLELRPLDLADDAQVRRVHEIGWRAEKEDGRTWNDFWTYDELARVLREPTGDMQTDAWCAFDGDRMVGAGVVELSLLDNLDKAFVFPVVEPELRGRGIGGFVLDGLLDQVRRQERPQVLGATAVPYAERDSSALLRFAQRHGFEVANVEVVRSLLLPQPDGLLAGLSRETAGFHEDYTLESYVDELPERHLESYCHLLNQLALDAPTGDIDFEAERLTPDIERERLARAKRMGRTTYVTLAVKDGEAVAHSDLYVLPTQSVAHQLGTLVRRDHRGHRLGTAVKVANLAALVQARPDVTEVHTQNAESNAWMVDINVRLGFEPVGVCLMLARGA
jgi:GNAT superfamily N-acetyltransferase